MKTVVSNFYYFTVRKTTPFLSSSSLSNYLLLMCVLTHTIFFLLYISFAVYLYYERHVKFSSRLKHFWDEAQFLDHLMSVNNKLQFVSVKSTIARIVSISTVKLLIDSVLNDVFYYTLKVKRPVIHQIVMFGKFSAFTTTKLTTSADTIYELRDVIAFLRLYVSI